MAVAERETAEINIIQAMRATVPEGERGGMAVERFTVTGRGIEDVRCALDGRPVPPGEYTRLVEGWKVWMSDTPAERWDHYDPVKAIQNLRAERVLVNGLGLGMVVQAALSFNHVQHIDVVESDWRVIALVGPHYLQDGRVHIHEADAYEQMRRWPKSARWGVAWTDIWPTICSDNLPEMGRFNRFYGRRAQWHGCWAQIECARQRRHEKVRGW